MHAGLAYDQKTAKLTLPPQISCINVTTTPKSIMRFFYNSLIKQLPRLFDYKLHCYTQEM